MLNQDLSINVGKHLEWSFFYVTICSYKSTTFLNDEIVNYKNGKNLSLQILNSIRKHIPLNYSLTDFFTLVNTHQHFELSLCSSNELDEVLDKLSYPSSTDKINYTLFKNSHNRISNNNANFDNLNEKFGTFIAAHGSHMHRFYSILQNGLQMPNSNDIPGIFGSGIYLTNKLDVALHFAQAHLFDCGIFEGHSIKAVAICQVIKHPNAVVQKLHSKSDQLSLNCDICPEYTLVKDESMVRVTHVLIQSTFSMLNFPENNPIERTIYNNQSNSDLLKFIRQYWLILVILIYVLILVAISHLTGISVIFSDWESSELLDINHNN